MKLVPASGLKLVILSLVLASHLVPTKGFTAPPEDQQAYEALLREANLQLGAASQERSCPGVSLTLTCGNHLCELDQGENEITCPEDCLLAPVKSYNSETFCTGVKKVYSPKTLSELESIVQAALQAGEPIRAIGHSHTSNSLICNSGVEISTENLNRILGIEVLDGAEVVTVEPGVRLSKLTNWLDQKNRSLGYRLIQFRGVTIAGAIATGAHGSSAKHSSVLSSAVESITWVGADGKQHEARASQSDPETFGALRANLGMLGIVVQIKLKIQKQFNLETQLSYHSDADLFKKDGLIKQGNQCDFAQLLWFPHSKKYIQECGKETQKPSERDAENILLDPPVPNFIVSPYQLVMHYGACYPALSCALEDLRYATLKLLPPLRKIALAGTPLYVNHVIGKSHQIMTSDLTGQSNVVHEKDLEVAVPWSQAQEALKYIATQLETKHSCLPLVGFLIRFVLSEDNTLIAHTVSQGPFKKGEPTVLFEMPTFLPVGLPPELYADYEQNYHDIAMTLIQRFKGRAHWGKNDGSLFELQKKMNSYGDRLGRFKAIMNQFDPHGVLSNEFVKYF